MPETFVGLPEELRGKTPEELRSIVEYLDAHLKALHEDEDTGELRSLEPDEESAFEAGLAVRDRAMEMIEEHTRISEIFRKRPKTVETALFNINRHDDDPYGDVRRLTNPEARDRALRVLEDRNSTTHLSEASKDEADRVIRTDTHIARRVLVTENDAYRSAWAKMVTSPHPFLNAEETDAMRAWEEFRAMSEGTTTAGGFGVPVFIDPSIILTGQASNNPFLQIARQVTVNTKAWKGVSSAGVTWSFDTEASEVSDDSPVLAQPVVDVYMARGFIPFSIEVGMDYPNFASEMSALLAAGYDELLIDKFSRGSGTGEPRGVLTALVAQTTTETVVTTDGAFGQEDIYKVWAALPQRFRRNASWLMNVGVNNRIRQMGTSTNFHAFSVDVTAGSLESLFAKPVYESPYFPDFTGTTGAASILAVGDFSNYVIARNGGMSVELVPTLFGNTTGTPTGQRGWFAYSRIGGNVVVNAAFQLLVNT
jgi:HK97 family phage major capsid protein